MRYNMPTSPQTTASENIARKHLWGRQLWRFLWPFLVGNAVIFFLYISGIFSDFFRVVFVLYAGNFLLIPAGSLAHIFWTRWNVGQLALPMRAHVIEYAEDAARIVGSLLLLGVWSYASVIEPQWLRIEQIAIKSAKVSQELRILHISDIQSPWVGWYEERVFREIERLRPDLIIHTGDLLQSYFFTNPQREQQKLAALFRRLHPAYGIYNVVGDVDGRLNRQAFDALAGITTLSDAHVVVKGAAGTVNLLGLSLQTGRRGNRELIARWQQSANPAELTILFAHAPDYILNIQEMPIDFALAGHTHGGQIRVPGFGALLTLSHIPREWAMGYRQLGAIHFNVSAGIGTEHAANLPPIRFNCPPAMTMFLLNKD